MNNYDKMDVFASKYYFAGIISNEELDSTYLNTFDVIDVLDNYQQYIEKCEEKYFKYFIKGYIDSIKNILSNNYLKIYISNYNKQWIKFPYEDYGRYIVLKGTNVIDFLGTIYPLSQLEHLFSEVLHCKFFKICDTAIVPSKTRTSDVGYDISIIGAHKKLNSVTSLYNTGIKLQVPHGYYGEIVPRSSLSKSGYMLANSMGVIDPAYTGEIYIALTKVAPESADITFPFKCCQLIVRPHYQLILDESPVDFDNTHRNDGGFGSTNKK